MRIASLLSDLKYHIIFFATAGGTRVVNGIIKMETFFFDSNEVLIGAVA